MKWTLRCCEPVMTAWPSGYGWRHSSFCRVHPNLKVQTEEWKWTEDEYPPVEQENHDAAALAEFGCSACGVRVLPHKADCAVNPFFEEAEEYATRWDG